MKPTLPCSPVWRSPVRVTLCGLKKFPATVLIFGLILATSAASADQRLVLRLGSDRFQTLWTTSALAWSPDSRLIAALGLNSPTRSVRLFDASTGEQVRVLKCPGTTTGRFTAITFSFDGDLLICGDSQGVVTGIDVTSGEVAFQKKTHPDAVKTIVVSPDGKWWASGCRSGGVVLRSAADRGKSGRLIARREKKESSGAFVTGTSGVVSVCFTPDSQRLIAASPEDGGTIEIYEVETGTSLRKIRLQIERSMNPVISSVWALPDGRTVLSAGQETVPRAQTKIKFGAKNVTLSRLSVWDLASGQLVRHLNDKEDYGFGLATISPDGESVAVADFGKLTCRKTAAGVTIWTQDLPGIWGSQPVWSPDGRWIAMRYREGFALFDAATGNRRFPDSNRGTGVLSASWSADGNRVVTGHTDGYVRVWNATDGSLQAEQMLAPVVSRSGHAAHPVLMAFNSDGRSIIAAGRRDDPVEYRTGVITVFDRDTGAREFTRTFDRDVRMGSVSHDGRIAAVATSNGGLGDTHLYGIDLKSGDLLFSVFEEQERVGIWSAEAMTFSGDNAFLHVAIGDSEILTIDVATGKEVRRHSIDWRTEVQRAMNKPRTPQLWKGDFNLDGTTLFTSSAEYCYLWDGASGRQLARHLMPHLNGCYVCSSIDGRIAATTDLRYHNDPGEDVIRLLDPRSGDIRLEIPVDDDRPRIMRFSPDGQRLLTSMDRGGAAIWDVRLDGQ